MFSGVHAGTWLRNNSCVNFVNGAVQELLFNIQEEIASCLRIAKQISEEETVKVKKFTEAIRESVGDIHHSECSASKMLNDYMHVMKLRREFSKHPPLPEGRSVLSCIFASTLLTSIGVVIKLARLL